MLPSLRNSSSRSLLVSACKRGVKRQSPHDEKMEALVSLYHQSNTFITPENLSAAIDQAFTQPLNLGDDQRQYTFHELSRMQSRYGESQRLFLGKDISSSSNTMGPGWTESRSRRVDKIYRALVGTQGDGRPSWLALKENGEGKVSH